MGITAKELAEKLNLSAAAVSMALHNKPGVSTQTRQLVYDTALKYGFDFSRISEKKQVDGSIYLIIYQKHGTVVADTPFFSKVIEGVSLGCKNQDYKMKTSYVYEEEDTLARQIEDIRYSDCAGIILLGTEMTADDLKPFLSLPVPLVLLDTYFDTVPCDSILINNHQGAYLATLHLFRRTKKQPGYLRSSYPICNFAERSTGFYNAIRDCGMSTSKSIVHYLSPTVEGACADMREILRSGEKLASCYFADNDLEDIAIVGFDNSPISSIIEPALTTIHVPKQYMGEFAASRLIERMQNPGQSPVKIQIATTLLKRQTT